MPTDVPTRDSLMNPLLEALRLLGGSGSVEEINEKVVEIQGLDDEIVTVLHSPERSSQTELAYRLAWVRTYLKAFGVLENSKRGVWSLTEKGSTLTRVDPREVTRAIESLRKRTRGETQVSHDSPSDEAPFPEDSWREQLHSILTQQLAPDGFERLVQRLLRESGFIHVEVTGKTGDGGIDGRGIARIHGFMSFHVYFQCKRYRGSVGASEIRDFRGAMTGRADKGLFITTGTFSPQAVREANRDGAPPIDLIDGDELADKLKETRLGMTVTLVEEVRVDEQWYRSV